MARRHFLHNKLHGDIMNDKGNTPDTPDTGDNKDKPFTAVFTDGARKFKYNFEVMSASRIFFLIGMARNERELNLHPPQNPIEKEKALSRSNPKEFFAVLLIGLDTGNKDEIFDGEDPTTLSSYGVLDHLTGKDYEKLAKAKADFFTRSGEMPPESILELKALTEFLKGVPKEHAEVIINAITQQMFGLGLGENSEAISTVMSSIATE